MLVDAVPCAVLYACFPWLVKDLIPLGAAPKHELRALFLVRKAQFIHMNISNAPQAK